MQQFFELYQKENLRGFMKLEVKQSYREKWLITVTHSTNDKLIFSIEDGEMNVAFAKAYISLYEHLFRKEK